MSHMRATRTWCLLTLTALTGCGGDAAATAAIDAFRRSLADPAQHAVRKDGAVDDEALKAACLQFVREHGSVVAAQLATSLAALPDGRLPAESDRTLYATLDPLDLGPLRERAVVWAMHVDAAGLVQTAAGMLTPLLLRQVGQPHEQLGRWLAFLSMARPALTKVASSDTRVAVVADYGGLDTLVLELERGELGWTPTGFTWWRPKR